MGETRVCSGCGFENPPAMRYCGNCGRWLETSTATLDRRPAPNAENSRTLAKKVDEDTARYFRQADLTSVSQHRRVTILFADLSRFTELSDRLEPDDLYEVIQEAIQGMVSIVYRYEGVVDKIIGDGIMAIFGAPTALENHSERAVRAALEIQQHIRQISADRNDKSSFRLNFHAGINEGIVIVGAIGSDQRVDYTAIGETVNLANRLQEIALEGEILVSESVFRATQALFEYAPAREYQIKGYQQLVMAHSLLAQKIKPAPARGIMGLSAPMVGRERELGQLIAAGVKLVQERTSQFVLVTGEAGIGKSRLKSEFKQHLHTYSLKILEGQSLTYRRSVPYWIFKELLLNLLDLAPNSSDSLIRKRLEAVVDDRLEERAQEARPFLEHLLIHEDIKSEFSEQIAFLEAEQVRQNIFRAVRDLFLAESRIQPIILVLEDLHWADDTSLDLVKFLVSSLQSSPIMVLALSRPDNANKIIEFARQAEKKHLVSFTHIKLGYLSPEQSEQLFSELLRIPDLPSEFRKQIFIRTEGIPFYLEESLRKLIDEGVIEFVGGKWRMVEGVDINSFRVPDKLHNLVLARIDLLTSLEKKVLQVASVIGTSFPEPVLAFVLPEIPEDDLGKVLACLVEKAHLSAPDNTGSGYRFRHVLTSDCIYSTLLRRDKQRLHGKVAEAIETYYSGFIEDQIEILAGHYMRSSHLEQALRYLVLAGEKASREYANQQACHHFQEALALLPRGEHNYERARRILTGLGDVLVFLGDCVKARNHYQEAITLTENEPVDKNELPVVRQLSSLYRKIATTFERHGDYPEALRYLSDANQVLDRSVIPSPIEKASINNSIGWIFFLQGKFSEARKCLASALRLVEGTKHYDVLASIHNRIGAVAYQERSYFEAEMHVSESLVLRELMNDKAGVARLYNNLGLLGLMRGNLRMAEDNFAQCVLILEGIGDAEGIALANINLGLVKIDRGDLEEAGLYLGKGLYSAEQISHRYYTSLARLYIGRIQTEIGEFSGAEKTLRESLEIFTELGAEDGRIDALCYLADNNLASGKFTEARSYSDSAASNLEKLEGDKSSHAVQHGRVIRLQGKIARVTGDLGIAKTKLEECDRIFSKSPEKLELGRTYFELGMCAKERNTRPLAIGYFQKAYQIFDQLGADRDLIRVKSELEKLSR